jgi:hypothetical protein
MVFLSAQETHMFDLTQHLTCQDRALKSGMIKQAARAIAACQCQEKRARAMAELRKMQRSIA